MQTTPKPLMLRSAEVRENHSGSNLIDPPQKNRRIYRRIGMGYLWAIAIGGLGSLTGMVIADYFQGLGVFQLLDAQVQSQVLSEFEQAGDRAQLHEARTLAMLNNPALVEQEVANLQRELAALQDLQQKFTEFLQGDPAWLAGDPKAMQTLLTDYSQVLSTQTDILIAILASGTSDLTQESVRALIVDTANPEMEALRNDLRALIKTAQEQEQRAVEVMETAQGYEKLIIVLSMLLAGGCAGVLAWRTTREIARPIEAVTQVARRVAHEGDYTARAPVNTQDEVGILAQSLNQLIERVATRTDALQAAAQTAEVQNRELEAVLNTLRRTQAQLVHAEKMSSLGQLVAGLAHEINNPVNFIYGNVGHAEGYIQTLTAVIQRLQQEIGAPSAALEDYLAEVELDFVQDDLSKILISLKNGAERISSLVLSLRVFARLQESQIKRVDLHEGIESTLLLLGYRLRDQARRPEIRVQRRFGDLPLVECCGSQINQVVMNILVNAVDAIDARWENEPGGWQPLIILQTRVLEGDRVEIVIANNGPALSTKQQEKVFDPFFTTKPTGQGTSLGLSVSYEIVVEQHGGHLTCRSPLPGLGCGVEFGIVMPIRCAAFSQADASESTAVITTITSEERIKAEPLL